MPSMRHSLSEPQARSHPEPPPPPADPFPRLLPWLLLLAGLVGTAAAFALTVEKVALLQDPAHVPSCSLNPVLNCGSVMKTPQAELFGFPNPLLGLVGFPVVAATGAALLAGARLRRWYWWGLQAGVTFGVGLVAWLVFQSLYRINALCPYCMVVWAVTIPIFWYVTLHNLTSSRRRTAADTPRSGWAAALGRNHGVILTAAYAVLVALIAHRFWDYWTSLVG